MGGSSKFSGEGVSFLGGSSKFFGGSSKFSGGMSFFGGGFSTGIRSMFGQYASYWNAFLVDVNSAEQADLCRQDEISVS